MFEVTKMKLKWSLAELQRYRNGYYPISGVVNLTNALKNRKDDLIDASPVEIEGTISLEGSDKYYVDLKLDLTLTMPSSRSLEPVELDMTLPFHEVYLAPDARIVASEEEFEDDLLFSLEKDILDLQKPIEDTILASIPLKVLSEEEQDSYELPSGRDWSMRIEDEMGSETVSDESAKSKASPFDILKDMDLFSEDED